MFIAYFDESGDQAGSEAMALAGFVAYEKRWVTFEEKWEKRLRRDNITVFHMTDFENRRGEFKHLSEQKRRCLQLDLLNAIRGTYKFGVCHSLIVNDYRAVMLPQMPIPRERKRGAYILLLQSCLEDIYSHCRIPQSEKIIFVFEQNDMHSAAAVEMFFELKKARKWDNVFSGISFEKKKDIIPLQAADMLAYEWYKHTMNQAVSNPVVRRERPSLSTLLKPKTAGQVIKGGHYGSEELQNILKHLASAERTQGDDRKQMRVSIGTQPPPQGGHTIIPAEAGVQESGRPGPRHSLV